MGKIGNTDRIEYLEALEEVVKAIIRYTGKDMQEKALELAEKETDTEQKMRYEFVAANMKQLAEGAPKTLCRQYSGSNCFR